MATMRKAGTLSLQAMCLLLLCVAAVPNARATRSLSSVEDGGRKLNEKVAKVEPATITFTYQGTKVLGPEAFTKPALAGKLIANITTNALTHQAASVASVAHTASSITFGPYYIYYPYGYHSFLWISQFHGNEGGAVAITTSNGYGEYVLRGLAIGYTDAYIKSYNYLYISSTHLSVHTYYSVLYYTVYYG